MRKHKYKVIKKKSRMSALINGRSKYARKYIKGESTYAREGTLGIMVFTTRGDAAAFIASIIYHIPFSKLNSYMIVRVLPIGRGQTVKKISYDISTDDLDLFYNILRFAPTSWPPPDTMAYPGVFVID
jgi:hypothetical protein